MKRTFPILILAAALFMVALAAGCDNSSGPKSVGSDSVAVVGSEEITKAQLTELAAQVQASYKAQKRPYPKKASAEYKALQDQLIQYLVQVDEFQQKGKDLDVEVTDKDLNARLAQVKKQYFGSNDKRYRAALKAQGLTEEGYRASLKSQLLSEKLFTKVTSDVKVSDADVRSYYNTHGQYERRSVRHILVNSKALANRLYAQLNGGANFAALAKKYSKDPGSAAKGGKLDISKGQTVPEFDATAFSLKTGQLSKPVHTQFGWHIILAEGAVQKTPLKQVKESIRQQLLQQKRNDAMTKFVDGLKKDFCDGQIAYQVGYAPTSDPCVALTTSTSTSTSTGTTTG